MKHPSTQQRFKTSLLAALACAAAACGTEPPTPAEDVAPAAATAVVENCQAVSSIEIVHRVNGTPVTDRLRLVDDVAGAAPLALRAFQVAADYYGAANIVSSRPIQQVYCFAQPAASARQAIVRADPPTNALCVLWNGVQDCTTLSPSHVYDIAPSETCSFTNFTDAVSVACDDSKGIVTRHGDVVLTVNTQNILADIAARTQVIRALLGNANVLTNIHFDISITPDQQASIVDGQAYNSIAQQIQQATNLGQPLPDIQQILHNLTTAPQNVNFYTQLLAAQQTKIERAQIMASVADGKLLSSSQVNALYQSLVSKGKTIDKLVVDHSPTALGQAAQLINDSITQTANTSPSSTVYNQVKGVSDGLVQAHTSNGVFDPDHKVDVVVPNLYQSASDADVEKRLLASDVLRDFNQQIQKPDGQSRARAMAPGMKGMADALSRNDKDAAYRLYDTVKASEFFLDHTDPAGTSYDVHLTPDAAAMFNLTVAPNSLAAYEVILVLNEAATFNAATGKVTVDYHAVLTLNARAALSANSIARATYHTEEAWSTLSFLKNAGGALAAAALVDLALDSAGVIEVISEGWEGIHALRDHLRAGTANWPKTLEKVLDQGLDTIRRWPNMTPQEGSELVARIAGEILQTIPPDVLASPNAEAAIEEAIRLHLDKAARGLNIVEHGGVALKEDAAVELVKQLDSMHVTALQDELAFTDVIDDFVPCDMVGGVGGAFAPGIASGDKPPCTSSQVSEAFQRAKASAAHIGVTAPQDVEDLFTSREHTGPNVERYALNKDEYELANKIAADRGGNFVGARRDSQRAIDGFFMGDPVQLKYSDSTSPASIITNLKLAYDNAANYREIGFFFHARAQTREEVIRYILNGGVRDIVGRDYRIKFMRVLTSDGFWVHVQDGVVR